MVNLIQCCFLPTYYLVIITTKQHNGTINQHNGTINQHIGTINQQSGVLSRYNAIINAGISPCDAGIMCLSHAWWPSLLQADNILILI